MQNIDNLALLVSIRIVW